eukprot:COSAG06_NODE_37988_length_428_cov_2.874763_2_plen_25_part_01
MLFDQCNNVNKKKLNGFLMRALIVQ